MTVSKEELAKEITVAVVSRMTQFSADKFVEKSQDIGKCAAEVYNEILRAITEGNKTG